MYMKQTAVLVSIYAPIDGFPPTINLINEFSHREFEVYAIEVAKKKFKHSKVNFKEIKSLNFNKNLPKFISNYFLFFIFLLAHLKIGRNQKIKNFVVFDCYSLLSIFILKKLRLISKESKVWYHNHDIGFSDDFKIFSLGWLVHKVEPVIIKSVDFFTLPSKERSSHFKTRACDFVLPNYPSVKIYDEYQSSFINKKISLIFQGRISSGHGFESIIKLLNLKINGYSLELVLKGMITGSYKEKLLSGLSPEVLKKIMFIGYTDYEDLPIITSSSHIGIAIHQPRSLMHATLGTASNKIYEYIACGLPIIYLDNDHFNYYLDKYKWSFPVLDSHGPILNAIEKIINNYDSFSKEAKNSFTNELNYEVYFDKAFAIYNPNYNE